MSTSLQPVNTLGVPSVADDVYEIRSTDELRSVAATIDRARMLVLGGGSNVVLAPHIERPVCLIRSRGVSARCVAGAVEVEAAAGENWHELVRWTLGRGIYGLENLSLIPGSVGAAPVQNIGAYGVELSRHLLRLQALDLVENRLTSLSAADCELAYRHSVFKRCPGRFVITAVTLRLSERPALEIGYPDVQRELAQMGLARVGPVDVAEAVIRIRRRKLPDPRHTPNVGSFFKNPVVTVEEFAALKRAGAGLHGIESEAGMKLSAAAMIDRCGFKALADGPVRVWYRQPLVLTNPGRVGGEAVLAFAARIQDAVEQRFGIRLEIEPDVIGFSRA